MTKIIRNDKPLFRDVLLELGTFLELDGIELIDKGNEETLFLHKNGKKFKLDASCDGFNSAFFAFNFKG